MNVGQADIDSFMDSLPGNVQAKCFIKWTGPWESALKVNCIQRARPAPEKKDLSATKKAVPRKTYFLPRKEVDRCLFMSVFVNWSLRVRSHWPMTISNIVKNGYSTHFLASLSLRVQWERTLLDLVKKNPLICKLCGICDYSRALYQRQIVIILKQKKNSFRWIHTHSFVCVH